jgi:DNA primase small subunit
MNRRTREYLRGRFGDYYRSSPPTLPPAADDREWGHIPWSAGGTTMVRHQSLLDLGDLGNHLATEAPQHVYFSSAYFEEPGADSMDEKGWRGADLVFDLDADHLPGVDPEATGYPEMLDACKDALLRLLELLERDFGFDDDEMEVVFSGGRGYHVHVRDASVRGLDSEARREIVDYVRGIDVDRDGLVETRSVRGTTRRVLRTEGGWGRRVNERLQSFVADLRELSEAEAKDRLQEFDGIGTGRAETVYGVLQQNPEAVAEGNLEAGGPGLRTLVSALIERTLSTETAPIDEPVTTDTKRLIRLPGSLHGGSGLVVQRIDRDAVSDFEPLDDAVPDRFRKREIRVEVTDPGPVRLDGETVRVPAGDQSVRECVGVFLMTRGRAEKARE